MTVTLNPQNFMHTPKIKTLKPLPHTPTKKQVKRMYPFASDKDLTLQINTIIKHTRKTASGKTPRVHRLYRKEFEELVDTIGAPVGYEKEFRP